MTFGAKDSVPAVTITNPNRLPAGDVMTL